MSAFTMTRYLDRCVSSRIIPINVMSTKKCTELVSAFTMTRYLDQYESSRIIPINVMSTKKVYRADECIHDDTVP